MRHDRFSLSARPSRFALVLALCGPLAACGKEGEQSTNPEEASGPSVEERKLAAKTASLVELANRDLGNGRYVSAMKRAQEALDADAKSAPAYAVLGAAHWRAGDFTKSTEAFEQALELDPRDFSANLGLARNLQTVGNHARAVELMKKLAADDKTQVDPLLVQLWSYYALNDADNAIPVIDGIFKLLDAEDPLLPLVQAYASYLRALEGKGEFFQLTGESGVTDLQYNPEAGVKHSGVMLGSEFVRAVILENTEETVVDLAAATAAGLTAVGKYTPPGADAEAPIYLIPEIKVGELSIKNVPAVGRDLSPYEGLVGEKPGLSLGRQALLAVGAVTFDFPGMGLSVAAKAPEAPPAGASELPLLLVSMKVQHAPAVPLTIDGADHTFFAYLGGTDKSGVSITRKAYLKSGHRPADLEPLDDANAGLKMVYVDGMKLGEVGLAGAGGLVLTNNPPAIVLGQVLDSTGFELGGILNFTIMRNLKLTYAFQSGRLFVENGATAG